MGVLQQVCLQLALPPATCCLWSLLQLLWTLPFFCQRAFVLPCSHCLHIFACQKKSNTHLSTAEDNTCKLKKKKKVMVSINHFPILRDGRRERERADSAPPFPSALIPDSSVIPIRTTRVGSEGGFFYLCSLKDDATRFSIICRSLKYPVDGISTLRLTVCSLKAHYQHRVE